MTKPTKQDADLFIKVYNTMVSVDDIKNGLWFAVEELDVDSYEEYKEKYPVGSERHRHLSMFLSFMEFVGVLVKYEVINEDLVFDLFPFAWEKVEPIVRGWQKEFGPHWKENYVAMVKRKEEWRKRQSP